jgi:syntaxin 16
MMLFPRKEGIQMSTLGGGNNNGTFTNKSHPPPWVEDVDRVNEVLGDIQRQMEQLHSMHATRVGSVFGKDLDNMEGQIEKLTRDITDAFRFAERLLQKVGMATKKAGGEEATVGANVQRSLAKRLQELSVTFRQSQRKYLAEVQAQKSGGFAAGDNSRFGGIDFTNGTNSSSQGGSGDFFTMQQMAVVDDLTEAVQSRDQEIVKIAQSIEELGAIFKELAVLVIDQGTILDRIDYNMEAVVEHTKTGIQQLERAEKSQKSARPLKCILCLLSLIFVLLLILVLKHKRWR